LNAIPFVVKEVIFTGSTTRTIVETASGAALLVAGLTVEADLSASVGRSMVALWQPEHTVLLPGTA
jgi:hypothetical protein